jgi:hypothetical protein
MKQGGMVTTLEGMRDTCKILIPIPKGKPALDKKRYVLRAAFKRKLKKPGMIT